MRISLSLSRARGGWWKFICSRYDRGLLLFLSLIPIIRVYALGSVKYIGSVLSLLTQFAFARRYHLSFPFDKGNDRYRAFYRDFARKFVTISHVMAVSRDGGSIHRWHVSFSLDFSSRGTSFLSLIENVRQKFTSVYIYACVIKFWSFGLQIFSLSFSFSFCLLTSSIISIYNIVFNEVI